MTCGIYEIVNKVNGKRYVGSSVDIEARWRAHLRELRRGSHHAGHLQNSWNKYGEDNFGIYVILECERDALIGEEQKELDAGFDYNSSPTAGSTLGYKFSDEARQRVRQNRLDRYAADPEGYSAMMSSLSRGKPKSDEWKIKMSNRLTGVEKSDEHKEKMARSRAELTKEKVLEVREMRSKGFNLKEISELTGVSWGQCQRICSGERYQWAYDFSGPVDVSMFPKPQSRPRNNEIYTFYHENHGERTCTQFELKREFPDLRSTKVSLLCNGGRKVHRGWSLKEKSPN